MAEPVALENELKPPDEDSTYAGYNVTIQAIRKPTKELISALLNPPKIFLSDSGLPRDWHGLAQLVGIGGEQMPYLQCGPARTNKIFSLWYERAKEAATIKQLFLYLEQIDRYDIIDDVTPLLDEDIKYYEQNSKACVQVSMNFDADNYILTTDDVKRVAEGLEPQRYDAFVLFADDDINFATEVIDRLENQFNFKLCVKDRDLAVGVFEHESVIRLISERCNRLVAIVSNAFLESSSNKFFCSFAQSLGIEQRRRNIVPISYTDCKVPPELSCYFILKQNRPGLGNFWERLRDSIRTPTYVPGQEQNIYRSASQKIPSIPQQTNGIKPSLQYENNSLKPKKEGVKFNSMVNLSSAENENPLLDQNLNPSSSATSLNTVITIENKKTKTKVGWFKKLLPHKNGKRTGTVIEEVPEHHKKGFFTLNIKRKVAAVAT